MTVGRKRSLAGSFALVCGLLAAAGFVLSRWVGYSSGSSGGLCVWITQGLVGADWVGPFVTRSQSSGLTFDLPHNWIWLPSTDGGGLFERVFTIGIATLFRLPSDGSVILSVSLWPIAVLGVASGLWLRRSAAAARRKTIKNACPACGYDKAGIQTDAPCPECGKAQKPQGV